MILMPPYRPDVTALIWSIVEPQGILPVSAIAEAVRAQIPDATDEDIDNALWALSITLRERMAETLHKLHRPWRTYQ